VAHSPWPAWEFTGNAEATLSAIIKLITVFITFLSIPNTQVDGKPDGLFK
jgi:hypothetical protein